MADANRKMSLGKSSVNFVFCHLPETTSFPILWLVNTEELWTNSDIRKTGQDTILICWIPTQVNIKKEFAGIRLLNNVPPTIKSLS